MARPRITQRHFIGWVSVPRRTALPASPGPRAPAGSRRGREAGRALGIFGGPRFALILVPVMPGQLRRSFAPPKTRRDRTREGGALSEPQSPRPAQQELRPPRNTRPNSGGRGSVRAAIASAGSAGASPSQKMRDRTREGEDPSEPQSPRPAQQELRPPRNTRTRPNSGGRGSVRAAIASAGSAGASPSQKYATELGRARLCPGRNRLGRLSGSFALPRRARDQTREGEALSGPQSPRPAQRELRPPECAARPNSGGRGSVRAAIASAGSAGASPHHFAHLWKHVTPYYETSIWTFKYSSSRIATTSFCEWENTYCFCMSIWETPAVWAIKYQFHSDDPCSQYGVSGKCKMCKVVASPSQKYGSATELGRARLCPSRNRLGRLSGSFALPEIRQRDRTREGEDPSEPRSPRPAQQELRPPRNTGATELGRARLCPSRNRLGRLSGSFALPRIRATELGRARLCPGRNRLAGSAGASPSQKYVQRDRTREGEALSEPRSPRPAQQEIRPPEIPRSATELGRARLRPSRNRLGQRSSDRINPPITEEIGRIEVEGEDVEEVCWDTLRLSVLTPMALNGSTGDVDYSSAIP